MRSFCSCSSGVGLSEWRGLPSAPRASQARRTDGRSPVPPRLDPVGLANRTISVDAALGPERVAPDVVRMNNAERIETLPAVCPWARPSRHRGPTSHGRPGGAKMPTITDRRPESEPRSGWSAGPQERRLRPGPVRLCTAVHGGGPSAHERCDAAGQTAPSCIGPRSAPWRHPGTGPWSRQGLGRPAPRPPVKRKHRERRPTGQTGGAAGKTGWWSGSGGHAPPRWSNSSLPWPAHP